MSFRTHHVQSVCRALEDRLSSRLHRPGDRFATARQIADQYAVSYQTAHRVLADLAQRGLIERRPRSGTFIAGTHLKPTHAHLLLHPRASNPHGFGGKLRQLLLQAFAEADFDCVVSIDPSTPIDSSALPIIWESPDAVSRCVATGRPGILVNERPKPGWGSSLLDSVCTDDYAGGALAADTLLHGAKGKQRYALLAGPRGDRRSDERKAGFQSRVENVHVIHASNWHRDAGRRAAAEFLNQPYTGIFAANDRLAQGLLMLYQTAGQKAPRLIGYDDAPIAQQMGLTTIALPWIAIAKAIVERTQCRLNGDRSPACTLLLQPSIVFHEPIA